MTVCWKLGAKNKPQKTNKKQEEKKTESMESTKKAKKVEELALAIDTEEKKPKTKAVQRDGLVGEPNRSGNELEVENSVLCAENAKLNEKIEKLQKALHDLM